MTHTMHDLSAPRAGRAGSVRRKLLRVVFVTTGVALLIAALGMLAYDVRVTRHAFLTDLATEADILATATAPALAFNDPESAARNLDALQARPSVQAAALYDAHGRLWRGYTARGQAALPDRLPATGAGGWSVVHVAHPVVRGGEALGTVYLRAEYRLGARLATYLGISALVTAVALLLALFLSQRLQRTITGPLESMTDVARGIVADRNYALRVPASSDDEFGVLVDAFNAMLAEVDARTRALEAEVEARAGAEAALRVADRRKDEFLAILAHELRNPLAPVRNAVRVLESPNATDAQRQWGGQVIARQVGRMALLLDDLLDVSRITRGVLVLKPSLVALDGIVQSAVETAQPLIAAKSHRLDVALPAEPVQLRVDPLRLSQAISNLLTNAAKYTDRDGRLAVQVRVDADGLLIEVRDSGVGIDAASIPHLFDMFTQVGSAIDRSEGGLGIGLALVKGLIELHGGSVHAASAGLGRGSTFTIRLPSAVLAQTTAQDGVADREVRHAHSLRIVVVDDNCDAADSLAAMLRLVGHQVWVGYDGAAALALGASHAPDTVLLDIGMPGMSGYDVARQLRAQPWGHAVLLVAITGFGQAEDRARAHAAGFSCHLTKPVNPSDLDQVLNAAAVRARAASG